MIFLMVNQSSVESVAMVPLVLDIGNLYLFFLIRLAIDWSALLIIFKKKSFQFHSVFSVVFYI